MIGAKYGGPLGALAGSKIGSYAHYIGKIFGSGDYVTSPNQVKHNVLVNESQIPQFVSSKDAVRIRHREFLGDLVSSGTIGAFQIQQFPINPGRSDTFEWLSQVCGATFQQYRLNGCVFEFRSMSADALNSTNTALGSVVMATDYDSADSAFTTKSQMENTEFGVSCKPSSCMIHAIECDAKQTSVSELYIRANSVPSGKDIRFYDLGQFYVATTGMQAASVNLGELWVSYDVTLFKSIQQPAGWLIPSAHYQLDNAQVSTKPLAVLSPQPSWQFDTIGLTFPAGGLSVQWPLSIPLNSIWLVNIILSGTAANATTFSLAAPTGGMVTFNGVVGGGSGFVTPAPTPGTGVTEETRYQMLQYTGGGTVALPPTMTVVAPATPLASYTACEVMITMVNGSFIKTA